MRKFTRIRFAAILVSLIAASVFAQNWNVEQVSSLYSLWCSCRDVAVQGNLAYIATYSSGFSIADISDPENPVELSSLNLDHAVDKLSVLGGLTCCKAQGYGFILVNTANPDSIYEVSRKPITGIQQVLLNEQYLYAVSFYEGILIFDITDPSLPTLIGHQRMPYHTRCVAVSGDHAFACVLEYGIISVEISDPADPEIISLAHMSGYEYLDIESYEDYLYVATGSELHIVDISNPAFMEITGEVYIGNVLNGITQQGNYVFAAGGANGLFVIDVSNPNSPFIAGSYDTDGQGFEADADGGYLYFADNLSLLVFRIDQPQSPVIAAELDNTGHFRAVAKQGDMVYLGDCVNGLRIVDVSDPVEPFEIDVFFDETVENIYNIEVIGDYAYMACNNNGFTILEISDPVNPVIVSTFSPPGNVRDVDIDGNYAYLSNMSQGFRVVDISDLYHPVEVGYCDTYDWPMAADIAGNYAYIADFGFITVVDISDPTHPTPVGHEATNPATRQISVQGDYAYIACQEAPLYVFNISNPEEPRQVFEHIIGGYSVEASDVETDGDFAFLTTNFAGFQVLNIANPWRPIQAGYFETMNSANAVVIDGNYAYVSSGYHVEILDCSEAIAPAADNFGAGIQTAVEDYDLALTASPNPFNAATTISFELQAASQAELTVFDITGRRVWGLGDRVWQAGRHEAIWDAGGMSSGVYFVRLEAGDFVQVRKLLLIK